MGVNIAAVPFMVLILSLFEFNATENNISSDLVIRRKIVFSEELAAYLYGFFSRAGIPYSDADNRLMFYIVPDPKIIRNLSSLGWCLPWLRFFDVLVSSGNFSERTEFFLARGGTMISYLLPPFSGRRT